MSLYDDGGREHEFANVDLHEARPCIPSSPIRHIAPRNLRNNPIIHNPHSHQDHEATTYLQFVISSALPVQKSDPWREPADATERVPGKSPLQQRDTCDVSTSVRETLETAKQARNINADNKASVS